MSGLISAIKINPHKEAIGFPSGSVIKNSPGHAGDTV